MKRGNSLLSVVFFAIFACVASTNAATVAQNAATFSGSGYLRTQRNTQQFSPSAAFTYELWFKAEAAGALINEVHQFTESLWDYNLLEVNSEGRLVATAPGVSAITGPPVDFGTWHHAAIRYNPATQDLDLFLDGAKVVSSKGTRLLPWDAGHTVFLTFGRSAPTGPQLRGQVDEVRLWRTVLTDAEIAENRRVKLSNPDTRLFAMWSLDVVEGSSEGFPTTPDRSGNSNPALIVGTVTLTTSGADLVADRRPSVTTGVATVEGTGVTLNGNANSSVSAVAYFRYGLIGALDRVTPAQAIPAGANSPVQAILEGLVSAGNYSYSLVVSNEFGTGQGEVRTFVAPNLRPIATTGPVRDSATTSTVLTGAASSPIPAVAHFKWGESELTNRTANFPVAAGTVSVEATLENLVGGRAYRYALVVTNEAGVSTGATRTFTKIAPSIASQAAIFAGNGYLRSKLNTQQFFRDAAFTYELWFKADAAGALINEVHQFTESLWDHNFLEIDTQGRLIAAVPGVSAITGPSVQFGTWHHTAIRYNPTTKNLDLFLDGAKVGTSNGTRLLPWDAGHTVFMTFGRSRPGGPSLRGQVDEVRMWRTALSDADIATNRDLKLAGPDGRLFAMWSLDVIQGSSEGYPTSPDRSGNNNPALLVRTVTLTPSGANLSPAPTVALKAATMAGSGYLRSQHNTQQFFHDAAFTFELWFKADAAGALINEVHQFTEPLWDYNFLRVDGEGRLIAAVPGVTAITGPSVQFGTWHHAALRYNPTTQDLDLFLDGVKRGTSKGTRLLPWDAGYTVFMTFGRSAPGAPWLRGQV
ncbi:MAG TPA: LamG domain-containing protein, partial [Verrucomicrobiae bacterium]|nr:LamG domain-containing protein [Verrucomicrobiae bacterium]